MGRLRSWEAGGGLLGQFGLAWIQAPRQNGAWAAGSGLDRPGQGVYRQGRLETHGQPTQDDRREVGERDCSLWAVGFRGSLTVLFGPGIVEKAQTRSLELLLRVLSSPTELDLVLLALSHLLGS